LCHGDILPTSYVTTTYKIQFGPARCTLQPGLAAWFGKGPVREARSDDVSAGLPGRVGGIRAVGPRVIVDGDSKK